MITEIQIENYKSIQNLKMNLGRVNVFIGENGCGKSNILEAIALAAAAASRKLNNEFLAPRGIRVVEPQFMRSAFDQENIKKDIKISFKGQKDISVDYVLIHGNQPYSYWDTSNTTSKDQISIEEVIKEMERETPTLVNEDMKEFIANKTKIDEGKTLSPMEFGLKFGNSFDLYIPTRLNLINFLIYSPENTSLRKFDDERQIQPLGIKGEGLFKLLRVLSVDDNPEQINEIKEKLKLLDWFDGFEIPQGLFERSIQIKDRYLDDALPLFDQRSSNEGFLFLLFYFTLFISIYTPKFFAIDNIDASLNPKLCTRLIKELVELAKKHDKQVIFTTHNPAILDGLNLDDDEQRLFAIHRNISGHTKTKRILKPQPLEGQKPVKLSESFMRGYIGGLPEGF
jgi:AAA15 family ATPase/GTPase